MAKDHNASDLASDGGGMSIRSESKVATAYRYPKQKAAAVRTTTEPNDAKGMHHNYGQSIERTRESRTEPFDSHSSQETYAKHAIMGDSGGWSASMKHTVPLENNPVLGLEMRKNHHVRLCK